MDRLPRLGLIAAFGVGYDGIDVAAAKARGIRVTHTPDVLTEEVADLTFALLLGTVRRIPQADRYVRDGRWPTGPMPFSPTLRGKRLGILGLGRIGRAIARRAEAFGVAVAYCTRQPRADAPYRFVDGVLQLARDSDVLVVACPGGDATRGLVDRAVLQALGPEGILINIARGSVVDEDALIACLQEGTLGSAGLDVFRDEPNVPEALIAMTDRVVVLPHIGSATHETRTAMGNLVIDNVAAFLERRPLPTEVPETAGG